MITNPDVDDLQIRLSINLNEEKIISSYFMISLFCCRYYQLLTEIPSLIDFLRCTDLSTINPTLKNHAKMRIEQEYHSNLIKFSFNTFFKRIMQVKSLFDREMSVSPNINLQLFIQRHQDKTRNSIELIIKSKMNKVTPSSSHLDTSSNSSSTRNQPSSNHSTSPPTPPSPNQMVRTSPRTKRKKDNQSSLTSPSKKITTPRSHKRIDTRIIRTVPTIGTMNNFINQQQASLYVNEIKRLTNDINMDQMVEHIKKKVQLDHLLSNLPNLINVAYNDSNAQSKTQGRFNLNWSCNFGFTTQAKGATGFDMVSIDGRSYYNWQYTKAPQWQKDIWNLSQRLIALVDSEYFKSNQLCVQVSVCGLGDFADIHTDAKDVDYQMMVCAGDYDGGQLRAYNESLSKFIDYDLRYNLIPFDPRLPHSVLPVTRGMRYSLIIYRHHDDEFTNPQPIIDYVDANPAAVCVKYPVVKTYIENIALAWINDDDSRVTNNTGRQILRRLRESNFQPRMKDRIHLKEFICHVNNLKRQEDSNISHKQSKSNRSYILLCECIYYLICIYCIYLHQ